MSKREEIHGDGMHALISMLSTPPSRESDAVRASLIVRWTLHREVRFHCNAYEEHYSLFLVHRREVAAVTR